MKRNRFFDTIMIALILMIGFKLLYPDAFTQNITVNVENTGGSSNSGSSDSSGDNDSGNDSGNDNIDTSDLPEITAFMEYEPIYNGYDHADIMIEESQYLNENFRYMSPEDVVSLGGEFTYFYANAMNIEFIDGGRYGKPVFVLDGEIWYSFEAESYFNDAAGQWTFITPIVSEDYRFIAPCYVCP